MNVIDFRRAYDDATLMGNRVNHAIARRVFKELGVTIFRAR